MIMRAWEDAGQRITKKRNWSRRRNWPGVACGQQHGARARRRGCASPGLPPEAGLVAGFLGAEGVFEADAAAVDDRQQQDQDVGGLSADVCDTAGWVLGVALPVADGAEQLADLPRPA
jgi:hypothetical protein